MEKERMAQPERRNESVHQTSLRGHVKGGQAVQGVL